MSYELAPDVALKVDRLVEEVAGRRGIGGELRDELRGHVEDKILAYLSGDEALTQADAFILAREHFGATGDLRVALGNKPAKRDLKELQRRIGAVMSATLIGSIASMLGAIIAGLVASGNAAVIVAASFFTYIGVTGGLLLAWHRGESVKNHAWFVDWRAAKLVAMIAGLFVAEEAVSGFRAFAMVEYVQQHPLSIDLQTFVPYLLFLLLATHCILWLWWCGVRRVFSREMANVFLSLCLLIALQQMSLFVVSLDPSYFGATDAVPLFAGSAATLYFQLQPPPVPEQLAFGVVVYLMMALNLIFWGSIAWIFCRTVLSSVLGQHEREVKHVS